MSNNGKKTYESLDKPKPRPSPKARLMIAIMIQAMRIKNLRLFIPHFLSSFWSAVNGGAVSRPSYESTCSLNP